MSKEHTRSVPLTAVPMALQPLPTAGLAHHPWHVQSQAGWGPGQPGPVEGVPAHGKGAGTR